MKTVIILVLLTGLVMAGNPDERASMEFDLKKHFTNYERSFPGGSSSVLLKDRAGPLNLDVRVTIPSRENLSLILGMGYIHEKRRLLNIEDKQSGFYLNIGMKIYLPEQPNKNGMTRRKLKISELPDDKLPKPITCDYVNGGRIKMQFHPQADEIMAEAKRRRLRYIDGKFRKLESE